MRVRRRAFVAGATQAGCTPCERVCWRRGVSAPSWATHRRLPTSRPCRPASTKRTSSPAGSSPAAGHPRAGSRSRRAPSCLRFRPRAPPARGALDRPTRVRTAVWEGTRTWPGSAPRAPPPHRRAAPSREVLARRRASGLVERWSRRDIRTPPGRNPRVFGGVS